MPKSTVSMRAEESDQHVCSARTRTSAREPKKSRQQGISDTSIIVIDVLLKHDYRNAHELQHATT